MSGPSAPRLQKRNLPFLHRGPLRWVNLISLPGRSNLSVPKEQLASAPFGSLSPVLLFPCLVFDFFLIYLVRPLGSLGGPSDFHIGEENAAYHGREGVSRAFPRWCHIRLGAVDTALALCFFYFFFFGPEAYVRGRSN